MLSISAFIITHNDVELITVTSEKGILDLSQWDEASLLKLTGEWQYYDGLMIKDLSNLTSQEYVYVPHLFKRKESQGNNPYGTATYKLNISGLDKNVSYSIQILSETSAYRLTANGQEVLSAGKVGYKADEHEPEMKKKIGYFSPDEEGNAELLMEISNFSYNYGGFWREALLGNGNVMYEYSSQQEREQIFIFSSILILGLFFLGLYSINGCLDSLLYFSFICLLSAMRVLLTNYKLFYDFIYELTWDAGTRLEFLSGYLLLPFFVLFFNSLNYTKPNNYVKILSVSFMFASTIVTLFTGNEIYAEFLKPYIWLCVLSLPYFAYVLIEGVLKKMEGAIIMLAGTLVLVICILIDSFIYLNFYVFPIGSFFMLICFSVVVIKNLVEIMRQNDYLGEVVIRDHLTDLHNRYYINNLLMKGFKVEEGKRLFVLFIDLNKFKAINDEYGHKVGDVILKESSKKLKESFHRDSDILCRYGGDEFLAFVNVKNTDGNIEGIISRIKKKFEEPVIVEGNSFVVGISIGISEFHNGDDMEKIIHRSDDSMYLDKQRQYSMASSI